MSRVDKSYAELGKNITASWVSAGIAVAMFNPLDTLRIRWQVTPPVGPKPGRGLSPAVAAAMERARSAGPAPSILGFARRILASEGLFAGLWRPGIIANSMSIAISSGIRMGFYPVMRDSLDTVLAADGEESKSPVSMVVASLVAGGAGYWTCTPTYQMKVRLQAQAGSMVDGVLVTGAYAGHPIKYRGLAHGLLTLAREEGFPSLFRGAGALIVRGALITLGQLTAYDLTKTRAKNAGLIADGPVLHVSAAIVAAFFMTTLSAPADILMTRYQTAPQRGESYRGLLHCASSMLAKEGPRVFFRGWTAFFARIAPLNIVLLTLTEQVRKLFGLDYLD